FYDNEVLKQSIQHALTNDSHLHIMGLLSDGGVHSHYNHMFAILKMAKAAGLNEVYVHGFLDGRDVGNVSALTFKGKDEEQFKVMLIGKVAESAGRYYAMDRDQRWDRVKLSCDVLVHEQGDKFLGATEGVTASYKAEVYDEFVKPFTVGDSQTIEDK